MTTPESSRPPARANLSATGPCLLFRACTDEGYLYQVDGRGLTATSMTEATRYPVSRNRRLVRWHNPVPANLFVCAIAPLDVTVADGETLGLRWGDRELKVAAASLFADAYGRAKSRLGPLLRGGCPYGPGVEVRHDQPRGSRRMALFSLSFVLPASMPNVPLSVRAPSAPGPRAIMAHLELLGLQPGKSKTGTSPRHVTRWTREFGDREIQVDTGGGSVPSAVRLFENGRILHEEDWTGRPFPDLQQGLARWAYAMHGTQPNTSAAVAAFQAFLTR